MIKNVGPNDSFIINTDGLEQINEYEEFLFEDDNVGFFYTDFEKEGISYFHTEYPSIIKDFPVIIIPKNKLEECVGKNPVEYLSKKYVAIHIPIVAYKVQ